MRLRRYFSQRRIHYVFGCGYRSYGMFTSPEDYAALRCRELLYRLRGKYINLGLALWRKQSPSNVHIFECRSYHGALRTNQQESSNGNYPHARHPYV
jgi:hypothetical protein